MRIRAAPSTDAEQIGSWLQGDEQEFVYFERDGSFLWGLHRDGYSAVYSYNSGSWFVAGTQAAALCVDVTGWPEDLEPPASFAWLPDEIDGGHVLVGANRLALLQYADKWEWCKALDHSQQVCLDMQRLSPETITIYRSLRNDNGQIDGPLPWEWHAPEVYYAKTRKYWPDGFDFYETTNEWGAPQTMGQDDWDLRMDFDIRLMELAAADGKCVLFGAFGPGGPPEAAWPGLVRVFRWIDEHGQCSVWPDGSPRYHGYAIHQTFMMPDSVYVPPENYINNLWITHRDIIFRQYAIEHEDYDIANSRAIWIVTEGGWEDYSVPNYPFSCEEVAQGWALTRAHYMENRPWIKGVTIWNFTIPDGHWVDLTACLPLMNFG